MGISDLREGAAAGICAGLVLLDLNFMFCWCWSLAGKLSAEEFGMETGGCHVLFGVEGSKGGFAVSFRS